MAFKEVLQRPENPTFGFGDINKKTNKTNPKQYEGYYLTSRSVNSEKFPDKLFVLHTLRTQTGDIDLWSKADLTRKMKGVVPGTKVRISLTDKTKKVGMGTMKVFFLEQDAGDVIEVPEEYLNNGDEGNPSEGGTASYTAAGSDEEESDDLNDESSSDEITPARPSLTARRPQVTDPARAAKVQALLNSRKQA